MRRSKNNRRVPLRGRGERGGEGEGGRGVGVGRGFEKGFRTFFSEFGEGGIEGDGG